MAPQTVYTERIRRGDVLLRGERRHDVVAATVIDGRVYVDTDTERFSLPCGRLAKVERGAAR